MKAGPCCSLKPTGKETFKGIPVTAPLKRNDEDTASTKVTQAPECP